MVKVSMKMQYFVKILNREYHLKYSNIANRLTSRSYSGALGGWLNGDLYEGIYYKVNFILVLGKALYSFYSKLDNDAIYCLFPKIKLEGEMGFIYKSLGGMVFYCKGMRLERKLLVRLVRLVHEYHLKYGKTDYVKVFIEYYKSENKPSLIIKYGTLVDRGYLLTPGDIIKSHVKRHVDNLSSRDIINPEDSNSIKTDLVYKDFPLHTRIINKLKNILVFDLETYVGDQGVLEVYACGFKYKGLVKTYYLSDYISSKEMLRTFIKEMVDTADDNTTIYSHNLARFDGALILRSLIEMYGYNYTVEPIIDNNMIKLIVLKINKKSIKFHDSLLMLNAGLKSLGKAFNLEEIKGYFPHDFVNKDNIGYIGDKPSIEYYPDITEKEYKNIPKQWNLREECVKYMVRDIDSLMEIVTIFRDLVYDKYRVDVGAHVTIPSLALKIYRMKYYKKHYDIKIIDGNTYYDIKRSFFGGRAEVYIPSGQNLYYYDVNSLYPAAMLKPMPVGNPTLEYYRTPVNLRLLPNLFGFAQANIVAPNNMKRPILPVSMSGRNFYPTGKWSGMYFVEELRNAMKYGYEIDIEYVYHFNKGLDIFKEYIEYNYTEKANSEGVLRALYKLLLNSLFGKFGMLPYNNKQLIIKDKEKSKYELMYKIQDIMRINEDLLLITFDPRTASVLSSGDIPESRMKSVKNIQSLPIASAITAYARIIMNKFIANENYNIYYTDTDSIVVDKKLTRHHVSSSLIGKMKLENTIIDSKFILQKVYHLITKEGKIIDKFKGVKKPADTSFYKRMIKGDVLRREVFTDTRLYRDIWSEKGIKVSKIKLHCDLSLRTRKMVMKDNLWIDTEPYSYEELVKQSKLEEKSIQRTAKESNKD